LLLQGITKALKKVAGQTKARQSKASIRLLRRYKAYMLEVTSMIARPGRQPRAAIQLRYVVRARVAMLPAGEVKAFECR